MPVAVTVPRRAALTALACSLAVAPAALGVASSSTSTGAAAAAAAAAAEAPPPSSAAAPAAPVLRELDFKTYRLSVPDMYQEVNVPLKDPASGVVSPTVMLLKVRGLGCRGLGIQKFRGLEV